MRHIRLKNCKYVFINHFVRISYGHQYPSISIYTARKKCILHNCNKHQNMWNLYTNKKQNGYANKLYTLHKNARRQYTFHNLRGVAATGKLSDSLTSEEPAPLARTHYPTSLQSDGKWCSLPSSEHLGQWPRLNQISQISYLV